jgi:phosphoribosylamine--glycine ligase
MKILVIGGGGREHAIVRALKRSRRVKKIWCAPGNAGIARDAECVAIKADHILALYNFASTNKIDLTIVGPEAPLVEGLVDHFRRSGLRVVGPTRLAARLEGSKSFAKEFMNKYGIPTARHEVVPNLTKGTYLLRHWTGRSVVKADGLAAGKGVKVCETQMEAKDFLYEVMEKEIFGAAGSTVVIEECLEGPEVTVMAFCDGKTLIPMPASQDHKRLKDRDRGANTGGMGAYAPAPIMTHELREQVYRKVLEPFLKGIQAEKFDFRGIVYFGLMLTEKGPRVLEFNVRFGDPETQVVLPLLRSDLVDILEAVADQRLAGQPVEWRKGAALCVVLASRGYPSEPAIDKKISGLEEAEKDKDVAVYHAGTKKVGNDVHTAGGRVLGVTGFGANLKAASARAYKAVSKISFDGMQFRQDIGHQALPREKKSGKVAG